MLPLSASMEWSAAVDLAIALVLGFGFGFCLERAGFGSARKLTAVFYLFDMAVGNLAAADDSYPQHISLPERNTIFLADPSAGQRLVRPQLPA